MDTAKVGAEKGDVRTALIAAPSGWQIPKDIVPEAVRATDEGIAVTCE